MKLFQIIPALLILGGAFAQAEETAPVSPAKVAPVAIGTGGSIAAAPLPEHRRTFVLVLGIAAVAVTFQRGLRSGGRRVSRS